MGKGSKHVLKAPKLKNKTYYQPTKDETFVIIINPPRRRLSDGQIVPNAKHIQTWLSAITGRPHGVAAEMYVIKTHPEPIIKLEDIDLTATSILGMHKWREFIRDIHPRHPLWDEQTVLAEYDVKRFNHPKNIQYQTIALENPDPQMYAGVLQPYPRPHPVDLSRDDLGFSVSSKARQIIHYNSLPKPPLGQQNSDGPKAEQDPRLNFVFPGIEQDVKAVERAEAKAADPRLSFVFPGLEQDVKTVEREESKADARRDRRGEVVFEGLEEDVKRAEEDERAHSSASVQVKQEGVQVKQEPIHVKQEPVSVKRETDDPRSDFVFPGIEQDLKAVEEAEAAARRSFTVGSTLKAEPNEDVKPFTSYAPSPNNTTPSVRVKEKDARHLLSAHIQPKPDPDAVSAPVKREDGARSAESIHAGGPTGRANPPLPHSEPWMAHDMGRQMKMLREFNKPLPAKRERLEESEQAMKRLKTEY